METPRQPAARIVVGALTERAKRGDATALSELRKRDPIAAQAIEDYRHLRVRVIFGMGQKPPVSFLVGDVV